MFINFELKNPNKNNLDFQQLQSHQPAASLADSSAPLSAAPLDASAAAAYRPAFANQIQSRLVRIK